MDTKIQQNISLAPYTTVKIGGIAQYFINTKTSSDFVNTLKSTDIKPITIIGNGSNILISDQGLTGLVIKNSADKIEFLSQNQVKVDSGVMLPTLLQQCALQGLSNLEEFAYIPSSIGGAIFGNIHGVNKNNFDKFLVSIDVFNLESNTQEKYQTSNLSWSYDYSDFQKHPEWIIISATLQLSPGDKDTSLQIIKDIIAKKITTQSMNSLGSVFKNPDNDSAGRIIDQELNLKGFQIGDAQISPKHANFIVNLGHATATDYIQIINEVISKAKSKGFDLIPEIKFLGKF
jgi:UDP-N-acetylmuramate dehydrogenase